MGMKKHEVSSHYALPPSVIEELDVAAARLRKFIPRDGRYMKRGPMIGYMSRWFLTLPRDEQAKIVKAGWEVEQQKKDAEEVERNESLPRLSEAGLSVPEEGDAVPDRPIGAGDGRKVDASSKDGVAVPGKGRRPRARK